jgi:hypothetical protein
MGYIKSGESNESVGFGFHGLGLALNLVGAGELNTDGVAANGRLNKNYLQRCPLLQGANLCQSVLFCAIFNFLSDSVYAQSEYP